LKFSNVGKLRALVVLGFLGSAELPLSPSWQIFDGIYVAPHLKASRMPHHALSLLWLELAV
jgi:hypothetical protein